MCYLCRARTPYSSLVYLLMLFFWRLRESTAGASALFDGAVEEAFSGGGALLSVGRFFGWSLSMLRREMHFGMPVNLLQDRTPPPSATRSARGGGFGRSGWGEVPDFKRVVLRDL